MDIRNELEQLRDEKYREFGLSLLPNVDKSKMIGVRLPQLRAVAARIKKESSKGVMPDLPQGDMFEEKLVRGFVIASAYLPFEEHLKAVADFVPEIDNWSVCDSFVNSLKFFKKDRERVWEFLQPYFDSDKPYDIRFAVAWAVSVFFVHAPEKTWQYLEDNCLDDFTFNKSLQKITESYRVTPQDKAKIRAMKRK